ncbi:hypothetical protein M1563_00145 [Patescibacteria group bacterium]|nr:hypothetical protein [Patescibacteria group bacterium]MCL5409893.1 hypothetical protein [Patescibacteria group bacterium]
MSSYEQEPPLNPKARQEIDQIIASTEQGFIRGRHRFINNYLQQASLACCGIAGSLLISGCVAFHLDDQFSTGKIASIRTSVTIAEICHDQNPPAFCHFSWSSEYTMSLPSSTMLDTSPLGERLILEKALRDSYQQQALQEMDQQDRGTIKGFIKNQGLWAGLFTLTAGLSLAQLYENSKLKAQIKG